MPSRHIQPSWLGIPNYLLNLLLFPELLVQNIF